MFYFSVWRSFTPDTHLHPHAGKELQQRISDCGVNEVAQVHVKFCVCSWLEVSANTQVSTSPRELARFVPWAGLGWAVLGVQLPGEVAEHLHGPCKTQPGFQNSRLVWKVVSLIY